MKKKRVILTIASFLLTILIPILVQRGWLGMLDWMHPLLARILTFVAGATALGLLFYAYWDIIIRLVPKIQTFKADNITTIRVVKMPRPVQSRWDWDMIYHSQSYISPYILSINAANMLNSQKYLSVRCCFFSALPHHVILNKLSTCLLIGETDQIKSGNQSLFEDSESLDLEKEKPMMICSQLPNEKIIRIYFCENLIERIKVYAQGKKEVNVCLKVKGFDNNGKEYSLETPRQTTVLLGWAGDNQNDAR